MKASNNIKLMAAVATASLMLSACGGGGGGNSTAPATGASTPAVPSGPASGVAPQTSVPTPTYAADSFQLAAFNLVNAYRNSMGVGMLKQDGALDVSAQAHTLYLTSNLKTGAVTSLDHTESSANANFYGDTPLSRGQKAGAPTSEWIGENLAAGLNQTTIAAAASDCIGQFLASVYHLIGMTANQESMGLGYTAGDSSYPVYTCATDFGTSTGVLGSPGGANTNSVPAAGGQVVPVGAVLHSPYSNELQVALAMRPEAPNPASDLATPGRPILVRVNAQNSDSLTVTQFVLTDSSGATVPARILLPASGQAGSTSSAVVDPNNLMPNGVAVLLPLAPLKASTNYTVTFNGARDGSAVSSTWTFTTAAN